MRSDKIMRVVLASAVFSLGSLLLTGCGVTEEQYKQLDAKKSEVKKLELQATGLKDERTRIENEIAEKNKRLEECNKLKQETQANLAKVKK